MADNYFLNVSCENRDIDIMAQVCVTIAVRSWNLWNRSDIGSLPLTWYHRRGSRQAVFILGIHKGNTPQKKIKKNKIKNLTFPPKKPVKFFFVFGPRIIHCYKMVTIKLLFNFNNFNSRLPASTYSQHHIKYFNPKRHILA